MFPVKVAFFHETGKNKNYHMEYSSFSRLYLRTSGQSERSQRSENYYVRWNPTIRTVVT